jgi:hemolysin activation/secretion protein
MQLDLAGSFFPAVWDVRSAFATITAATTGYFTLPLPTQPSLIVRGSGKKVFGDVPFQEAAFIGGITTVRTLELQRYAGDASLSAGVELRIPVAKFALMVPLKFGLLASEDVGRVYLNGDSPGGWHNAFGAGFWVAFDDRAIEIRVVKVSELGRSPAIAVRVVLP